MIIQASVSLDPAKARAVSNFQFVIRNSKGEAVTDPARFFTQH